MTPKRPDHPDENCRPVPAAPLDRLSGVSIGLNAAIIAVREGNPQILVTRPDAARGQPHPSLPYGPFAPLRHRTLEIGLRAWVKEQTGIELGYVEQLYTFGDRGRHAQPGDTEAHIVSIGYLALTGSGAEATAPGGVWRNWYGHFPWEDWRAGRPAILDEIAPMLADWARRPEPRGVPARALSRAERVGVMFGLNAPWDEEKALERYELLYEAGLAAEAAHDGREAARAWPVLPQLGAPMQFDHRRILATAMSRLRGKIKYRPVVFELMPQEFTLLELQRTVEAISGAILHKQNFRRLVETARLVEPTSTVRAMTGGRPAKLYRFRREVLMERPSSGVRFRGGR